MARRKKEPEKTLIGESRRLTEYLRDNLLFCARELHLDAFCGTWKGMADTKGRNFRRALRDLGNRSVLACIDGEYSLFNGKCYERIDSKCIYYAFCDMMDELSLPMWTLRDGLYYDGSFLRSVGEKYKEKDLNLIGFKNGILDLRGGKVEFKEFSPEFAVTFIHPYKYDEKALCPRWHAFLREVLPDKTQRVILQMSMGLGLLNRHEIGSLEQCLVLFGKGGNGKGVVYNTMRGLFGQELFSALSYKDLCSPNDAGLRARYCLRGKLFNWCSDDNADFMKGNTHEFKRIVSGEPVNDRGIGKDVTENSTLPYMVFNTNHLPNVDDVGDGMMRRLQVVCFEKAIERARRNVGLAKELEREYSGIFNWVVRGMREIRRRRFVMPCSRASYVANLTIKLQSNPVTAYGDVYDLRGKPIVRNEVPQKVKTTDLYEHYCRFCEANGVAAQSVTSFGRYLSSQYGVMNHRGGSNVRFYYLYGFKPECMEGEVIVSEISEGDTFKDSESKYITQED